MIKHLLVLLFFISSSVLGGQINKINILKKFVYPILLFSKSEIQATGTGFFIAGNSSTYLITARHLLYEDDTVRNRILEKWRGFNEIQIPVKMANSNSYKMFKLKVAPSDEKIYPIKITNHFSDLLIIKVLLPAQVPVNYVDLSVSPTQQLKKGVPAYIPGYPEGETEVDVISTKIISNVTSFSGRQQEVFLTESDSRPGVSGAPVFTFDLYRNSANPVFLGVYTGYEINFIKGKKKERGTVVNGNILIEWLKGR